MSIDTSAEAVARDAQDLRRLAQYFSEEHSTSDCRFSKMAARMDALAAERDALKAQVRAHAMSSTARDLADEMMNEKTDALIAQRDAALAEVERLREALKRIQESCGVLVRSGDPELGSIYAMGAAQTLPAICSPSRRSPAMTDADRIAALEVRIARLEQKLDQHQYPGPRLAPVSTGCVCPSGMEKICRAPLCPRQPWVVS